MILLTCTNCKARLEMDDAFAGGVCRCMYCGTIQTVPSHLKRAGTAKPAKALFKQVARPAGDAAETEESSSELQAIASVVANPIGSSSIGDAEARDRPETITPRRWTLTPYQRTLAIAAAGAVGSLLLLAMLLFKFSGDPEPQPSTPTDSATRARAGSAAASALASGVATGPNFCGVPIREKVVIYVLDRGSATGEVFGSLKEACFRSIESLGPEHQFQVIFWSNGTSDAAFPDAGPVAATAASANEARQALDGISAYGQSDVREALSRAVAARPGAIILATGKAQELDDTFVQTVESVRKSSTARIDTFAVGSGGAGTALKAIATKTGGEFRALRADALRHYAQ